LELTRELVAERLCASVHNFTPVRSIYRWRGEVFERVKASHPYEVPGISARPIVSGNPDPIWAFAV
jgi:periplasmic divalent cation tolerance protein